MSHLTEIEDKFPGTNHQELIFPCDCGDGDYLRITWDDDTDWRFLWIEHNQHPTGWRRIKDAWKILRGKVRTQGEIVLSDESIDSLHAFLGLIPKRR